MAPSLPRAATIESSRSNSTNASSRHGTSPSERQASSASSGSWITAWPLPSYPSRRVFSTARRARSVRGRRRATPANPPARRGAPRAHLRVNSSFSASRSCAASRAAGGGQHGHESLDEPRGLDRHVLELVGDHVGERGEIGERGRDRRRRRRSPGATAAAGDAGVGSRVVHSMPSSCPARASMRPS